jgi:hypothetical protein
VKDKYEVEIKKMTPYKFALEVADTEAALTNAKAAILEQKGTFLGDSAHGEFSVPVPIRAHIIGGYVVEGKTVTVTIKDSPAYIDRRMVASQTADSFGGVISDNPVDA